MRTSVCCRFARASQALQPNLLYRLQHPVTQFAFGLFLLPQQTLIYQHFQGVSFKFTLRSAHLPGCLECAATREDGQPSEQLLLLGPQEFVAPSNCPTQCLLSSPKITRSPRQDN